MTDDEAWEMEREAWTGGVNPCRDVMDPACVMVFPAPVGIVSGLAVVQRYRGSPMHRVGPRSA